jgi:hypothetical protein
MNLVTIYSLVLFPTREIWKKVLKPKIAGVLIHPKGRDIIFFMRSKGKDFS